MQIQSLNNMLNAMDVRPLTEAELAEVNGASIATQFSDGAIAGASTGAYHIKSLDFLLKRRVEHQY